MPPPPLIAVTSSEMRSRVVSVAKPHADPPRDEMVLGLRYLQALSAAGCLPVVVPPLGPEAIEAFLDRVDGICLSGGPTSARAPTAHRRIRGSGRRSPSSTASSSPSRAQPTGVACRSWPSAGARSC